MKASAHTLYITAVCPPGHSSATQDIIYIMCCVLSVVPSMHSMIATERPTHRFPDTEEKTVIQLNGCPATKIYQDIGKSLKN